ncbi:MAG: UvrD-helicase domain-containing protein [Clostridia bacterium]|nr:UvrD-helicase domain-containing protein [Clostridia bacterium]
MSERNWTEAQLSAINFTGKNLILSAAAGSGKTATLTERIIRLLKDPSKGAQLNRMLVVTFTVAAAGELKSRIGDALTEAISKDPGNASLSRQLASLEGASISTIDSFFKSELRPHFSALGLPPEFSILDSAEAEVLRKEAMDRTVEAFFAGKGEAPLEDFCALSDCLSTARNEEDLSESLLKIFADLIAYDVSSEALLKKAAEIRSAKGDFFQTEYSRPVKKEMGLIRCHFYTVFKHFASVLSENVYTEKYVEEAERLALMADELGKLSEGSFSAAQCFFDRDDLFPNLSSIKSGCSTDEYELFKAKRNALKKEISDLKKDFFTDGGAPLDRVIEMTADHIETLAAVFKGFSKVFGEIKRERGGVDFSDLAAFARKIFINEDGTPTPAAIETGKKYDYIFIDEYQDTNAVQDAIFTAVSQSAGRFMVGDVKQSIYGFRGSCPELFTGYRSRYADGIEGSSVFMSDNFRSDRCVIDLSNTVSRYIFSAGETPFEKGDELVCSKIGGDRGTKCEIILVERESEDKAPPPSEAECVAARISELLNGELLASGEPVRPKDIAILVRSGTNANSFVAALNERGISVNNCASDEFFDHGEVLLVLCLLNTADNPLRDIYLAGAMKSPLFGFSLDDLVAIRTSTDIPLWYSLMEYSESGSDRELRQKCSDFILTVNRWREAAKELYCDEVLRLIVSDTSLRDYGGDGDRKNADVIRSLKVLSARASAVAKSGGTLNDLIANINSVMEKADKTAAFSDPDSVTLLTVHRSKGLEYPICFLCDTSKRFNKRDSSEKLLLDRRGAIAMKLYDENGLIRCDNPLTRAVALQMSNDSTEEEARVLYVAMTRARERLIVSCKVKTAEEKLHASSEKALFPLDDYTVLRASCEGDWIIDALQREAAGNSFIYKKGADIAGADAVSHTSASPNEEKLSRFFEKYLDFSYDKEYLWNIPAKLSVSVLKPDILGSEEDGTYFDAPEIIAMEEEAPIPSFLSDTKKADAARRGTATHIFMQFCDYEALARDGAAAELLRLKEKRFISPEDAEAVRLSEIELFAKSELFAQLLDSDEVIREKRFNVRLPACDYTTDPVLREKLREDGICVTVQGVVDCIFRDRNGRPVLVDYKTDRLTPEELADKALAAKKLVHRHSRQLTIYKEVCEKMLGESFDRVLIYSLPLGGAVEVK